ncbi:phosphate starvation-inducible protein PhoH [Micromonospora rifamycinica]|uniref:PhoH-like protein n=1 Tax=Micromonospora rifamycinica TaxID=291594 RepID=A0A120F8S8_9ACTN|nr:phosphate starvation-inducible protein PhoH [Micromonospora rifamycinica]SCG80506.1 phosphate starvation-inducible protein PhoH [Micromonospora rifamycinica]
MTGTPPPGPPRVQTRITVPDAKIMVNLLGAGDEILRLVERSVTSDVHVRGNEITITGAPADNALAERLFGELLELIEKGETLTTDAVRRTVGMLEQGGTERPAEVLTLNILSRRGRTIRPKTLGQKTYVDSIDANTIVFGIGPAGTGKTYLAMAKAVQALQAKQVSRIILTRPAVEAGERLGFLPGTLNEKIDPYLRPLYDALHDMLDPDSIPKLMAAGTIEVAPLAYMRGRAQPYDARVLTPEGFQPFGSLRVGDLVIGSNGTPTPVIGIYPQGPKQVYRVTTQDGASTLCCGEHLWTVATPEDKRRGGRRTLETREMIGKEWRGHVRRYELPVVAPVQLESQEVPLDPYALGLLLGDGAISSRTTPAFSTADPELADALAAALPGIEPVRKNDYDYVLRHVDGHRGGVIVANPVTLVLRELGLAGAKSATKFVPDVYLQNGVDVRLAVLQGLLDTDGGPVVQAGRTCRVQYSTTSARLRDDVVYLVQSLGGVATWRVREAEGRTPGRANGHPVPHRADAYVVEIRLPAGVPPFRLARKRQRYDEHGSGRPMRFIDSIIPAGVQETMCIQVAAEDSLYVTDDFLVTHNTLNDAFIILDEAQNTTPEQMKMFLTRLGFGSKIVVTGDVTQVDLPGGTASGLRVVREILANVEDVHFAQLSSSDVVRHRLVGEIVDAYARWDERENQQAQGVHAVPGRTAQGGRAGRRR